MSTQSEIKLPGAPRPWMAREPLASMLRAAPRIARFYEIEIGADGQPDDDGVGQLTEATVVIVIEEAP